MLITLILLSLVLGVELAVSRKITEIDFKNVDSFMLKQPTVLEFYAPWCKHCKIFEQSYETIAEQLHEQGFNVGKVDISANQALAARFSVESIPTFFLYREDKMWVIKGKRTVEEFVDFCLTEYKGTEAIDSWLSAMGPSGRIRGVLIQVGGTVHEALMSFCNYFNVPYFLPYMLIAIAFAVGILSFTFLGIYVSVTHAKQD